MKFVYIHIVVYSTCMHGTDVILLSQLISKSAMHTKPYLLFFLLFVLDCAAFQDIDIRECVCKCVLHACISLIVPHLIIIAIHIIFIVIIMLIINNINI